MDLLELKGKSAIRKSSVLQSIRNTLTLDDECCSEETVGLSLDDLAHTVVRSLKAHGVVKIDALAGYSLGGRVALAMKRLSMLSMDDNDLAFSLATERNRQLAQSAANRYRV